MKNLREVIVEAFYVWLSIPLAGGEGIDERTTTTWEVLMSRQGVTTEEFDEASIEIAGRTKYWPKPVEILDIIKDEIRPRRNDGYIRDHVDCIRRSDGCRVLAHKSLVRDGYLIIEGEKPNGISIEQVQALGTPNTKEEILSRMANHDARVTLQLLTGGQIEAGGPERRGGGLKSLAKVKP